MTIDEALKNCEYGSTFTDQEYDQLAEWLEELKMYKSLAPRELVSKKQRNDRNAEYHKGFNDGYNKAIDDFEKSLIGNSRTEVIDGKITLIVTEKRIKLIAEQLKAGGTDE